ncbi:MAG: LuxR C-terminal-related transcriptional regulator [Synergistaceae bacterium]|nr:LuxR C-terminal-related transcriptional regulator [Synergistaceae bacterium]
MAKKIAHAEDIVYFPKRLISKVSKVKDYPLTVIEAPSGFGKTTSLRGYLRQNLSASVRDFWYTSLGESPVRAWNNICDVLGEIDRATSENLRGIGLPGRETMADVAAIMRECRCERDSFLVIDNYQLVRSEVPADIVNAFSLHASRALHVVFVTQGLPQNKTWHSLDIHNIGLRDFSFDRESVGRYFALAGIEISPEDLEKVHSLTGGWIAAIKLQMLNYKATGTLALSENMDDLIETAIWNRLSDEERDFLLSLSLFDSFSPRQASVMRRGFQDTAKINDLLQRNVFIPFIPDKGVYYMHSLLQNYLRRRFDHAGDDFRREMFRRAGAACETDDNYFDATRFYSDIKDYDKILSMPFTTRYFYNFRDISVIDFFERLIDECPEETLLKHPIALLTFGHQFFRDRRQEHFSKVVALIRRLIGLHDLPEAELSRIMGEFSMLVSFTQFNDITKMSEYHRKSYDYLKRLSDPPRSVIFGGSMPWTMSGASVFFLYWRESGALERTLDIMDDCLPYYVTLAGGHGAGGECLMRAEARLFRGNDGVSEILCHKAIYEAREAGQIGNCLCAELILARIAILRGDAGAYGAARKSIAKDVNESSQTSILRIGDLCRAQTDMLLGNTDDLPSWLRETESIRKAVYSDGQPYALMLHGMMLLREGRHAELYGITEPVTNVARRMNYLLPQVYHGIFLAAAHYTDGDQSAARARFEEAFALAMPDRVYLPFAEHAQYIAPLLKSLGGVYSGEMRELTALCERQAAGINKIQASLAGIKPVLTKRQREIALLMKDGLQAKEIAEKLFITENTVRSTAKIIYEKLDVHSRAELRKTAF